MEFGEIWSYYQFGLTFLIDFGNRYYIGIVMFEAPHRCVLAVDGGGTRCRLALSSDGFVTVVEVGSANVTTDVEAAVREIKSGLQALSLKAGLSMDMLSEIPAYFGLAGFQAVRDLERLERALPLRSMRIDDDRPAALRGALEDRVGGLIHSGTGSFFGVQSKGNVRLCGGWGAILGDCGSAAWFGKLALALVLDAEDGLIEKSRLTEALLDRFKTSAGILEFANTATPSDFGALAPMVLDKADDPVAQDLIRQAADHFERNLRTIGWSELMPVCLSGGLAPHLAPYLTTDVRSNVTAAAGVPLDGAIALAKGFAEEVHLTC